MKTYMVTSRDEETVTGYFETLGDAKTFVETNPLTSNVITMLHGDQFGVGVHSYKLAYTLKPNKSYGFKYTYRLGGVK